MARNDLNWAILGDTHFGCKNDDQRLLQHMEQFMARFIDELVSRNIKTLITLGDFFDRRKFVNFVTLDTAKRAFFEPLKAADIRVHMIVGNHDVYYRNTNRINSVSLLVNEGQYPNVTVYTDPTTVNIDGLDVLMLPWVNAENYAASVEAVNTTTAQIVVSHLELAGFEYFKGMPAEHGQLDLDSLLRFDQVWCGHFHTKSSKGNIHYLGTPYEMNWSDWNDPKGWHIFDGTNLEFIRNERTYYTRLFYDDADSQRIERAIKKHASLKDHWVKITIKRKGHPILFERFLDWVSESQPADINVIDETNAIKELVDAKITAPLGTLDMVKTFIDDELETGLDKAKIYDKIRRLYVAAKETAEDE